MGKNIALFALWLACLPCCTVPGHAEVQETSTLAHFLAGEDALKAYEALWKENTIVCFSADWCQICPTQRKVVQALAKKGYRVAFYDADKDLALYDHMVGEIRAVPMIVVFVDGKVKARFYGYTSGIRIRLQAKECKINVP